MTERVEGKRGQRKGGARESRKRERERERCGVWRVVMRGGMVERVEGKRGQGRGGA